MNYKYIFGPVPSRRLGVSLGVDLVPYKVCSFDCVYCECGRTINKTLERKEFFSTQNIIDELSSFLKDKPSVDYITFSGSGEPTLHNGIGKITDFLKSNFPDYKIALLTNGSLLGDKKVQEEINKIDIVIPSLDAVSENAFNKINRPINSITANQIIEGLFDFAKNYTGKIWIEIFIIAGINDNESELELFKQVLTKLQPDKIQLNSLDRPGTELWVRKTSDNVLHKVKDYLHPLPVEIISKPEVINKLSNDDYDNAGHLILSIIKRRPCTLDDLQTATGIPVKNIKMTINKLIGENKVEEILQDRGRFYRIKNN